MWTKDSIKALLASNNFAVERAVVALFERQTSREQNTHNTIERNGQGFSASDAGYLSYVAQWVLSGKHLTGKHLEKTRRMVSSYAGQLADIANRKAAASDGLQQAA